MPVFMLQQARLAEKGRKRSRWRPAQYSRRDTRFDARSSQALPEGQARSVPLEQRRASIGTLVRDANPRATEDSAADGADRSVPLRHDHRPGVTRVDGISLGAHHESEDGPSTVPGASGSCASILATETLLNVDLLLRRQGRHLTAQAA